MLTVNPEYPNRDCDAQSSAAGRVRERFYASDFAYRHRLSGCLDSCLPGFGEARDVIGFIVANGHEHAVLIGVIEQVMPGALTSREATVATLLHEIPAAAEKQRSAALQDEDVFLFAKMVVKLIRVLAGLQDIDPDANLGAAPESSKPLECRGPR
jgi:hypothetical protein